MTSLPARVWRKFTSAIADTSDPTKIGSAKWNDDLNIDLGTVCNALALLNLSADQIAYFTSASAANLTALTAYARTLIAAADAATARSVLGIDAVVGGGYQSRGLAAANNGGSPTSKIDVSADVVILRNTSSGALSTKFNTGALTCDVGAVGPVANGRDQAGAFSANSWIYFYFIYNGTTLATIASANPPATGPTLPSGYSAWAYIGSWRFNGSSQLVSGHVKGSWFSYDTSIQVLSGGTANAGTPTTAIDLSSVVPPTAVRIGVTGNVSSTNTVAANQLNLGFLSGLKWNNPITAIAEASGVTTTWTSFSGIFPNLAQTLWYALSATGGSAFLNVTGYEMPNRAI